ncbi:hypothetical protein QAD02_014553 [Eretmocerus hayati]|uniref:Uncharacterized protein n=1 Tax=Eretmocerus hayati TaxID=131215 RepID=A0ACC2P6W8_9HYME|nr:hypothetical protein QAD02_014553 [Eretmocerus hayati]
MSENIEKTKPGRLNKVMEKPVVESYREYLDMDTDEEEFDHQETPEPQDEAPTEPDKPKFTCDELNSLIEKVKELTVLPGLSGSIWNENCLKTVREYFLDPVHTVLSIFLHGGKLNALLGFPTLKVSGLTYFLRQPWQVYRPENFVDNAVFGSVNHRAETAILRFVGGLYAPLAFRSDDWPHIKRDEIYTNLNDFLIQANEISYKSLGMLMLYIPWEATSDATKTGKKLHNDTSEQQKTTLKISPEEQSMRLNRLEKCAKIWVKQIRKALLFLPVRNRESYDIRDEFEFWQNRFENLVGIGKQLKNHRTNTVIRQLYQVNSPTVSTINQLRLDIHTATKEARANFILIEIVLKDCDNLVDPRNIQDLLPTILYDVMFVFSESTYYNKSETVQVLLSSLNTYLVKLCIKSINIDLMFEDARKCHEIMKIHLEFCDSFSNIYDQIDQSYLKEMWDVSKEVVLKYSNAFKQRCLDCLEICNAVAMYTSLTQVTLGGTRGSVHEIKFRYIKDHFLQTTNEMRARSKYAMQISKMIWFQFMSNFRTSIADLENSLKNLLNELYDDAEDLDTSIEILFIIMKLKDRKGFSDNLQDKWMQVWLRFHETIENCRTFQDEHQVAADYIKLAHMDDCRSSNAHKYYLTRLHKMLVNASDWLGDCDF